jgi:putative ABC transport system ATP-binding protein
VSLERPTAGTLQLAGRSLEHMPEAKLARLRRTGLGFVFQAFHLVDELTATENVELPALLAGASPRRARERAAELLEQVGLADREKHLPSSLSGGERQRVAIARAMANEPTLVMADEPTGNLDSAATTDVLRLFERLHANGQTLLIVTHDERIAATADRLITMRDKSASLPTKALDFGAPDRYCSQNGRHRPRITSEPHALGPDHSIVAIRHAAATR